MLALVRLPSSRMTPSHQATLRRYSKDGLKAPDHLAREHSPQCRDRPGPFHREEISPTQPHRNQPDLGNLVHRQGQEKSREGIIAIPSHQTNNNKDGSMQATSALSAHQRKSPQTIVPPAMASAKPPSKPDPTHKLRTNTARVPALRSPQHSSCRGPSKVCPGRYSGHPLTGFCAAAPPLLHD